MKGESGEGSSLEEKGTIGNWVFEGGAIVVVLITVDLTVVVVAITDVLAA